jgi:MFS family permease
MAFGLLTNFKNPWTFFGMCMVVRFIQGIGSAFVDTAGKNIVLIISAFSVITIEFKEQSDKYIGYCEAASGIGLAIGPVIGSIIYEASNYHLTFIIYGAILLGGTIIIGLILPSRVNMKGELAKTS